jgi:hypothetical protein
MHRGSRSLIAICCVAVGLTGIARAEVVFGNLGASGTATVGSFNADIGSASNPFLLAAQGFIPAAPNLMLQSVGLWLFGAGICRHFLGQCRLSFHTTVFLKHRERWR